MILLVRIQKSEKFEQNQSNFGYFLKKTRLSQNHAGTLFVFKNEARKLKFGPGVPLYDIQKSMEQIFGLLVFIFGNMASYFQNFRHFVQILDIFPKNKNSKICSTHF